MIRIIEKNKRGIAFFMLLSILNSIFFPTVTMALTSGPSQPEASKFTPVSTSDMVNLFTGDFNYNIPLMDVDGYPLNISYNGGSFMDQEASWVGLGWNVNAGAVNRTMRGLPDDFMGDNIIKELNVKDNETYGATVGINGEFFGDNGLNTSASLGLSFNNYTGFNITECIGLSYSPIPGFPGTVGLGLSSSTDGLTISPHIGCSMQLYNEDKKLASGNVSIGTSFNSRTGLKQLSFGSGYKILKSNGDAGMAGNYSYDYSFGAATYIPNVSMPMHNKNYSFSAGIGPTIFGTDMTLSISGNYSKQSLKQKTDDIPAYGYLYSQAGETQDKVLLDFNREKDGSFSENSVILPLTNHTFDLFNISGQGISGSYRATRSDIGYVFDSRSNTDSESDALAGDFELGSAVKTGIDFNQTNMDQTSGKWTTNNPLTERLKFRGSGDNEYYEPAYFKEAGEMVVDEDNLYANIYGNKSVRMDFEGAGFESYTNYKLVGNDNFNGAVPVKPYRTKRAKRSQLFSYLTKGEYESAALQKSLFSLIPGNIPNHHIAEITTTKTDGTRYVYGLPVFNTSQIERSFNISGVTSYSNGTVAYSSGVDDSQNNSKGIDNYYSSTQLPPYAYSYLITAVLTPDFVDLTGNGPSSDDLGNYTLFQYGTGMTGTVVATTPIDYKWRTPLAGANTANFDEGLKTDSNDNKASYVYGEKQITYLKRIYTKNYVADFELQNRRDGYGVTSTAGAIGGNSQKLLSSIKLYSAPDFYANINNLTNAFIIKQVNFVYDYSLCQGIPNNTSSGTYTQPYETSNQGGKLTLKKIYFTYGNSKKGYLSPYEFDYNTLVQVTGGTYTPWYDMKANDRWGTFKLSPTGTVTPPNSEAPFVSQNKVFTDSYAAIWNLSSITLPSGGKILIDLESDDYAYVQDKRAAEMFSVVASGSVTPSSVTNFTVPSSQYLYNGGNNYNVLYFKLDQPISLTSGTSAATTKFKNEYMQNIENLNFRFLTNVNGTVTAWGYEYVAGYAETLNSGIVSTGTASADYGWVQLKEVARGDKKGNCFNCENPISRATWQFGKMHTPQAVFSIGGVPPIPNGSFSSFIRALANSGFTKNVFEFFHGMYGTLKNVKNYGNHFIPAKSWIKLNNPNRCRLGGGNRVKRITMSDEWSGMLTNITNNANKSSVYGQDYVYTTNDPETDYSISSGVASYEPSIGANENACRFPIYNSSKKEELLLAPDNDLYQEGPIGESFYPSPSVGYSKVTVSNLSFLNVTKNATGSVINEFYTAKDFPVIIQEPTDLKLNRQKSNPLQKLINLDFQDNMTASQGFCIELNDMHGKPKGTSVYDATGNKISSSNNTYKQIGNKLDNGAMVMKKDGTISNGTLGIEFDMVADFREQYSNTETIGIQGNVYFMMIGIFPLIIPPLIPSYSRERVRFRSAGLTKVVQRFGILEKVDTEDLGSRIESSNMLWDSESGKVLLTKTNTEFKDDLFSYNYPAYYSYSGMEPAYKNIGVALSFTASTNIQGKFAPEYKQFLEPGDECLVYNTISENLVAVNTGTNNNLNKCWVRQQGTDYYLIDAAGANARANTSFSVATTIKVIRSGKRNMQMENSGSLVTFNSPVNLTQTLSAWPNLDATKNVLNAGAVEYGNTWRTLCTCGLATVGAGNSNEYLNGTGGTWRQLKSYTYLTLRKQTNLNANTNIRKDGVFEKFDPFWKPNGGGDWSKPTDLNTSPKWTWANEVTEFSPYGFEVENKDALGRYSSAVYGYNNSLPVAVGSNAKYKQIAADNFEDYYFNSCQTDGHFNFKSVSQTTLTHVAGNINAQKFAHTGSKSIKVGSGQSVIVTKDIKPCQ